MARFPNIPIQELLEATNDDDANSMITKVLSLCSNFSIDHDNESDSDNSDYDSSSDNESERSRNNNSSEEEENSSEETEEIKSNHNKRKYDDNVQVSKLDLSSDAQMLSNGQSAPIASFSVNSSNGIVVNPSIVEEIEDDLDFYEKVSLVFLLYDSDDLALQRLITAYHSYSSGSISHCRPLTDWALHESSDNWTEKFLEALAIIGNFRWLRVFGYDKDTVIARFLPFNRETSLFVDMMRKSLYITCESMSIQQLDHLLSLVIKDMESQGRISGRYDPEFMEMNVLHWMSQRYLNVGVIGSCDNINLKNFSKHLKVMEEYDLCEYLEKTAKRCCRTADPFADQSISDQLSVRSAFSHRSTSAHSEVSQCQESYLFPTHVYAIDPKNIGFCVIINQKTFYKETNPALQHLVYKDYLEPRLGTDVDRDRLCEVFLNFGFSIKIWENLTHIEMVRAIGYTAAELVQKEHSCFVLCILSHGRKSAVYGVNSIAVEMDEIEKSLHGKFCPNLLQKPKIIIVQACQGLVKQNAIVSDIATDGTVANKSCPEVSDILTFWATVPGYAAFRDRIKGSWFIKEIWEELLEKSNIGLDMISMCVNVIGAVTRKRAPLDGELKAMTPQFITSFRKQLIFPYHRDARKAATKRVLQRYIFKALMNILLEKFVRKIEYDPGTNEMTILHEF